MEAPNEDLWLESGMALFWRVLEAEPELALDFAATELEFHGLEIASLVPEEQRARLRRRLEWFLFERDCGGRLAVERLLEGWRLEAAPELQQRAAMFLESWTGLFAVERVGAEGELELRDLGGLSTVRVGIGEAGPSLRAGDVLVGRLFPMGDGSHRLSPAAGVFRSPELLQALGRDLERLREAGGHALMRLSQLELERMFFSGERPGGVQPSTGETGRDPVGELEAFLTQSGVDPRVSAGWLQVLRDSPWRSEALVSGAGDAAGVILDQLAFSTEVDLERARALLLAAWASLHRPGREPESEPEPEAAAESSGESGVLASLREFDRDRASGLDLETSFRELERRLGLEPDEGEEDQGAPDFPGVVGAMVEEYLWETERAKGAERRRSHEGLRAFGGYTERLGVFENLTPREFLSFAAFWLPESRRLKSGAEAERMVEALRCFGSWAAENQGLESLRGALESRFNSLARNLPRAVVANALLPKDAEVAGELFEYRGPAHAGRALVRDLQGEEREVAFEERLLAVLEEGDLFRGHTREDGEFVVSCCYPPEAAGLRQSLA